MAESKKITILDAVVEVLRVEGRPVTAKEIYDRIVGKNLFEFGAKDPVAMVRAVIRKHLRVSGKIAGTPVRVRQMDKDKYAMP